MSGLSSTALWLGDALQLLGLVLSPLLLAPIAILLRPSLTSWGERAANIIDSVSKTLLNIAGWLGLLMACAMLATVIMRYVFGVGFGWAKDIWVYAFAGCFMLASAGALRISAHVRVDVLFSRMTLQKRALVDLIASYVFLFPLMILILDAYAPQLANSWGAASGRLELSSETDGLPLLFMFKTLVPIFAATMLVQGWANAVRAAAIMRGQSISAPALALNEEPHA